MPWRGPEYALRKFIKNPLAERHLLSCPDCPGPAQPPAHSLLLVFNFTTPFPPPGPGKAHEHIVELILRRSWASLSLCSSQGGLLVEVGGRRCGPSHHGGHTLTLGYPGWSPLSPSPSLTLSAEVFLNQLRTPAPSVWPQPPWWPHPHPQLPRVVSPLPFTFTPPGAPQVSWICLYCNGWLPETSANLEVNIDCFGMNKDTEDTVAIFKCSKLCLKTTRFLKLILQMLL